MVGLAALCLLLAFPLSSSQVTLQAGEKINAHQGSPHQRDLLREEETAHYSATQTVADMDKDSVKVVLFLAAVVGTCALMAALYCIYTKFYTKQQYLHTQLSDDADLTAVSLDPPMFFHTSVGSSTPDVRRSGYGSVSDTPSIISVPPSLSPPPSAMPFPPLFLKSQSLRTISAKDLEKSCI